MGPLIKKASLVLISLHLDKHFIIENTQIFFFHCIFIIISFEKYKSSGILPYLIYQCTNQEKYKNQIARIIEFF